MYFNKLLTKNEIIEAFKNNDKLSCLCFLIRKGDL